MSNTSTGRRFALMTACLFLTACATTETLVATPGVELTSVTLESASFNRQKFLLSFDVSNPNAFPLPVRSIKYRVMFDDERFAGGETAASFTVPANGEDSFAISVELDILRSTSQVTALLRGGIPDHVDYRLDGSLAVDIPFARPLPFSSAGAIQVRR
jgi:LEA14-like dessication related protein